MTQSKRTYNKQVFIGEGSLETILSYVVISVGNEGISLSGYVVYIIEKLYLLSLPIYDKNFTTDPSQPTAFMR